MSGRLRTSPWTPWIGLLVGALAWFADQQISSAGDQWDCHALGGPFAVAVGLVCIAVTAAAGLASWRLRPPLEAEPPNRTFARMVGAGAAAIFILAIAFGTWAGVVLPGCLR
jgi:hypothetical protein